MASKVNCAGDKHKRKETGAFRTHHSYIWRKGYDEDSLLNNNPKFKRET